MKPESRTLLHVTAFVCIFTLLLMTACGAGKTGSGAGTDINSQTDSALTNDTAPQTDSGNGGTSHVTILATSDMHANVMNPRGQSGGRYPSGRAHAHYREGKGRGCSGGGSEECGC